MKRKILYALLICLSFSLSLHASYENQIYSQGTEETESKLMDMIGNLDMNYFADSIEIDFADWGTCGDNNFGLPGIAGCFDEPVIIADYSKEPLKIQSLGVSLSTDPQRAGYTRTNEESSKVFGHVNLIKFPIIGMILDLRFMCLMDGSVDLAYLSAFDPLYDGMFTQMMYPDINAYFQPHLMLFGAVDCLSSSVASWSGGLSDAGMMNDRLRMGMPHYFGCWNAFPMGGWSENPDPILAGATSVSFALASSMRTGLIKKSIRIKGLDGKYLPNTMCGEKIVTNAFVKPQFFFQLVVNNTSRTVPLGASAPEWAEFKMDVEAVDNSAYWVFKRKCLYMGAAECSK